jgi:alpha-galactosidase
MLVRTPRGSARSRQRCWPFASSGLQHLECLPGTSTTTSHKAVDRIQHLLQCNIDEDLVLHTANLMKSLGLYDAGYNWVNIDDCYAEKSRDEKGFIVEDRKRFKSGMKNLTASIKELGFKTGIYGDSGWYTCAGYPGSFRNEQRDARTFQDWGFELLKFDTCGVPYDRKIQQNHYGKFKPMSDALIDAAKEAGKPPIIYSICNWGWQQVWLWGKEQGQSWRTTQDIEPKWSSISYIINNNSFITYAADFYGHNDLDMLQL